MESTVNENDTQKLERTSRSILRTRERSKKSPLRLSPGRRSPGRQSPSRRSTVKRSPARRSPARRSPARRSPARRSPARSPAESPSSQTRNLTNRNMRLAKVLLPRADDPKDELPIEDTKTTVESLRDDEDDTELVPLQSRVRESSQITRRSTRILSNMMKTEREQRLISMTRSVDRAVSLPTDRRAHMYDFVAEQKERGLSMQRDRDLSKILHYEEEALPDSSTMGEKSKKEMELVSKPQEWGGWIGALCLIFVLPISMILPQIACFNSQCNSENFRVSTELESYLSLQAIALYAGFIISLALASLVPIGTLIDGQQNKIGRLQYRINGIISASLAIIIFCAFEYRSYGISDFILDYCLQLSIVGWILGTVIAIGLYIKGGKMSVAALNMYGSTNNTVYDFWQGREVNPRIGPLDVKLLLVRANVIGMLILNSAVIAKCIREADSLTTVKDLNITVLIICSLQIFYCLDGLIFESAILTSFKILYEGTGYMVCVGNLLYPFLFTLGQRYLLYQKIHQSAYVLAPIVVSFFIGYIIFRLSNSQKNKFRMNPFSPALSHLDTISTCRGKRIISSGLWGHVRHPNYLGDIIIHWSLACAALTKDPLPYYPAIFCTIVLLHRAIRDDARCRNRYGSAWEQYCLSVKSLILKRVF